MDRPSITVVGAGIVGLACARALQQAGFAITVVDRTGPCAGASFGNAAHIAIASIFPQSTPGIVGQSWRLLRDPNGPLVARPGYVLRHWPWFMRFLSLGRPDTVTRGTHIMNQLLSQAWTHWEPLLRDADAAHLVRKTGALHVFKSQTAMNKARGAYTERQRLGITCETLTAQQAMAMEPALTPNIGGAVHIPEMGLITDTHRLCMALFDRIAADGGQMLRQEVTAIRHDGVQTTEAFLPSNQVVLAAGAWSARFAKQLGVRIPVVSERGYHVMLPKTASPLHMPVLLIENKIALTPMQEGLRIASMAEFTLPDDRPDHARAAPVFQGLEQWIIGTDAPPQSRWVGPRPSTPDSRPIIGRSSLLPNVLLAYGHGHLGMTLAGLTASLVTSLATDGPPTIDMAWVSPARIPGRDLDGIAQHGGLNRLASCASDILAQRFTSGCQCRHLRRCLHCNS